VTGFVDKLRAIVGDKGLILDDQAKHPYLTDWRENYLGSALAIATSVRLGFWIVRRMFAHFRHGGMPEVAAPSPRGDVGPRPSVCLAGSVSGRLGEVVGDRADRRRWTTVHV